MGQRTQVILIKEKKDGKKNVNVFHLQWGYGRIMYLMLMDIINVDYNKSENDILNVMPNKNGSWTDMTPYLKKNKPELLKNADINCFQSVYDIINVCENNNGALVISMKEYENFYPSIFKIGFILGKEDVFKVHIDQTDYVSPKDYAKLNGGSKYSDSEFFEAMDKFYKYFGVEYVVPKKEEINDWKTKVKEVAEELKWNISINENEFYFERWSPCDQDLCIELTAKDFKSLLEELENYYNSYVPDEEAKLWYGANKGEPSSMRDLLDDMEWCKNVIKELLEQIQKIL